MSELAESIGSTAPSTPATIDRRRYLAGPAALLGGPANVVMQLGLPPVGRGVIESSVESGQYALHPRKRSRTTLTYLAVAMLGTDDDRDAYREAVNTSHRFVRSRPGSPVKYNAFDPALQLWVAGCIYRGVVDAMTLFYGKIDDDFADDLYRESARFATTLQVPERMWPSDRAAFDVYWETKLCEVSFDDEVRRYLLDQVIDLAPYGRLYRIAFRPVNRFFTIGFLPQRFRDELGLAWGPGRQRAFGLIMRTIGTVLKVLPEAWRAYPFEGYLEEMRRRRAQGKPLV